jgi:16S rRNA (cytosine967-C5)-methyltransferase
VQAISFHTLRWLGAAEAVREQLVPRRPAPALDALLLTALALLWPHSQPPYSAHTLVNEAVTAAGLRHAREAGFVNAVLRRYLREAPALVQRLATDPRARFNHPAWWAKTLQHDWGPLAEPLMAAAQVHPPMALRVNRRRATPAEAAARLQTAGITARASRDPLLDSCLLLDTPVPVTRLPGFDDGWLSVQDVQAQRAARWLLGDSDDEARADRAADGWRVLDACAAPGGKTAHLLERATLDLLALDSDADRLSRVGETLERLGLTAQLKAADAAQPDAWWDGTPFDAILLDAPCSASGIVRRHPDIRWLRRPGDIATLAAAQLRLLGALWPLLKPGGRLLLATCSVFRAEGQHLLDAFLQRNRDATVGWLPGRSGHLLPLPDNATPLDDGTTGPPGDGFFYALLLKPR